MLSFGSPSPSRYRPDTSSPLVPQSSSPISSAQARRSGQYKSRTRASRHSAVSSTSGSPAKSAQDAERALIRERLLAKCVERRERDRARARASCWASSSEFEASSDRDVPMDAGYDEDDPDEDNEILISRILETEHRRAQHRINRSFDFEVGSSPGISEDLVEEFFNKEVPPDEDAEYEALYEAYIATLEAEDTDVSDSAHVDDHDSNMHDDFPMTPEHQIRRQTHRILRPLSRNILAECPSCSRPWTSQDITHGSVSCTHCSITLPPEAVSTAWNDEHPQGADAVHRLVVVALPDGKILSCAAKNCDWCYGL